MSTCLFIAYNSKWLPSGVERWTVKYGDGEITGQIYKVQVLNKDDEEEKSLDRVEGVAFSHYDFFQIPTNLTIFFPNMIALGLYCCDLGDISRFNLSGLQALKEISLVEAGITKLEGDLFSELINLELISLNDNNIQFIDKNVFDGLSKLKFVNLSSNPTINVIFAPLECDGMAIPPISTRLWKFFDLKATINRTYYKENPNCNSVCEDVRSFLNSEDFKDFTIKIGETELKVHKFILIARSPTIADMLRNNPEAEDLILQDIEVDVFKVVLDYIYNDSMPRHHEKLSQIFAAAGKLKLEKLRNFIGAQLCDLIDENNALEMLKLATKQHHEELKQKSFEEIKKIFPIGSLSNDLIDDVKMLQNLVDGKKAYDEKIRKADEEFQKLMSKVTIDQ